MLKPVTTRLESAPGPDLEALLAAVELRLAALGEALRLRDTAAIDLNASELHHALARAVDHFVRAAKRGAVPTALRHRLVSASGEVAAQRESLARATAALDRAIDVLMPRDAAGVYAGAERSSGFASADRGSRGTIQA